MARDKSASLDGLIARIRERAADPERRVEARHAASLDEVRRLGNVFSLDDLGRMVAGLRGGQFDPDLVAKAETLVTGMSRRKMPELPPIAKAEALVAAEAELGVPLPPALSRAYLEVADGGFGPGPGLMPLDAAITAYRGLRARSPGPDGCDWPEKLLPLIDQDGAYVCVDGASGRVMDFDPEELLEEWDPDEPDDRAAQRGWKRCFREVAPSVEVWLDRWLGSPTLEERTAASLAASNIEEARRARARIGAMTPEQRKAMGLPEVGWERVVWGGLGLDEPQR
ncbi:MAG TPA: SMI1/KNR4 family protein [Candidatus Limnocylindria bacterium]|nr:SMI1/KNR4 family protein [Candidatus Limnocylindria bacterium]